MIGLRVMRLQDAATVLEWENNPDVWQFSDEQGGYCLEDMRNLARSMRNYRKLGQLRYVIRDKETGQLIGTIDLFNIDFVNAQAQVGILIAEPSTRNKGFGTLSMHLLEKKAKKIGVKRIQAEVDPQNSPSTKLFDRVGYKRIPVSDTANPKKRIIFEKWLEG